MKNRVTFETRLRQRDKHEWHSDKHCQFFAFDQRRHLLAFKRRRIERCTRAKTRKHRPHQSIHMRKGRDAQKAVLCAQFERVPSASNSHKICS